MPVRFRPLVPTYKKIMNLLFYAPNLLQKTARGFYQHVPSSYLILKNYVKEKNPELFDSIQWHIPFYVHEPMDKVVTFIKDNKIDCLALGLYIWNYQHCCDLAQEVKRQFGDGVQIVVGGPNCSSATDPEWAVNHPYFDFSVAGDGERPFVDILQHISGLKRLNPITTKNIVYRSGDQIVKTAYKYWKPDTETSPYIELKEELAEMVSKITDQNGRAILTYETSRGCPYGCTFCDWTSGLTHKVSKRKADMRQELNHIMDSGIDTIYLGDANYGQWDSDVELMRHMSQMAKERGLAIGTYNMSKNKKHNVEAIFEIMAENKLIDYFKLSVQDSNPDVLAAIDRPDITWGEHVAMKQRLEAKFPDVWSEVEIIMGLPGQSRTTWRETIYKTLQAGGFPRVMGFEVLPQSPAGYDQEYRAKWQIYNKVVWYPKEYWCDPTVSDLSLIARPSNTVLSTTTFSIQDRVWMTVWFMFIQGILNKMDLFGFLFDMRRLDLLFPSIESFLERMDVDAKVEAIIPNLTENLNREIPIFGLSKPEVDTIKLIRPNFIIDEIIENNRQEFLDYIAEQGLLLQYIEYNGKPKKNRGLTL